MLVIFCHLVFFPQGINERGLACVASDSVRFRSKERGTRVKDRAKNGSHFIPGAAKTENPVFRSLIPRPVRAIRVTRGALGPRAIARVLGEFSRQALQVTSHIRNRRGRLGTRLRSPVFLCSETKRKRLLLRLSTDSFIQLRPRRPSDQ